MSEITYYIKDGRKYVPIKYYDDACMNSVKEGCTLIVKDKGSKMIRSDVDPAYAPYLAASLSIQCKIATTLVRASESRPHKKDLSEEERTDWEEFMKKHGESFRYLEYPSGYEIVETMLKELGTRLVKAHENPAVNEAWEHYKFMVGLTLKEDE
jgi:hypothetical protein